MVKNLVAVTNRRSVESYRQYQDDCVALADSINEQFRHPDYPNWRPIKFETDGLPRAKLIAHYLAMDVGVVTPSKDGMNLVAKEMVICNPSAALVLSTGAGTEVQLSNAGFYSNDHECYLRVENLQDTEKFADVFYKAAMTPAKVRKENGVELNKFLRDHDIDKWSAAFLDPSWTHEVKQLSEFYILMDKTSQVRRQIVERVLKGIAVRQHFCFSLENARNSLEKSCKSGTHILELITSDEDGHTIQFDISDELDELEKDLAFLSFIASEDINNVENFILSLGSHHPDGVEGFSRELDEAVGLLSDGDHFHYLFTDRDGTLKSYACSYPTSVQPAYSAVIQAQFARRCAQFCAILTTAPLMHIGILNVVTMPEGYYAYGASAGREWYFNPAQQFKDETVNETDMALLNKAFEAVEDLLEQPAYRNFTWIGSGLQKHYGHITIARQDVNHSVPGNRSAQLTEKIHELVSNLDPEAVSLTVWEGEFDLKIFAKTGSGIFDKGDGIRLLVERLGLKMNEGNILVCGDSETDLPMLEACMERCAEADKVYSIWVTVDEQLRERVRKTCAQYDNAHLVFVSCPVVLLGAMAQATVRQIKIRPGDTHDNDDE